MELIKRYIYSIERRLPNSGKEDIVREIESIIMDELEGKFGAKTEYTKEEVETVLLEMGHPREVASRYRGEKQYLIGPELYFIYQMVLWIVLGATALGLIVSFVVGQFSVAQSGAEILIDFIAFVTSILTSLLTSVGTVTVIFMLIERFMPKEKLKDMDINQGWKPKDLPEIPQDNDKVTIAESIVAMTFTIIWAVLINAYANHGGVGFLTNINENIIVFPIFDLEMVKQLLLLWNFQICLTLVTHGILLFTGKWQVGTRLVEIVSDLLGIAILILMITGPLLVSIAGLESMLKLTIDVAKFSQIYYTVLRVILGLSILGLVVKVVKMIVRQAQKVNA